MRVILDTNVLLAALISPHGTPNTMYRAWRAHRIELVTSTAQLDELRRVSRYPKLRALLPAHRIGTMVNNIQRSVVLDTLPPLPASVEVNDPCVFTHHGHRERSRIFGDRRPARGVVTAGFHRTHAHFYAGQILRRSVIG